MTGQEVLRDQLAKRLGVLIHRNLLKSRQFDIEYNIPEDLIKPLADHVIDFCLDNNNSHLCKIIEKPEGLDLSKIEQFKSKYDYDISIIGIELALSEARGKMNTFCRVKYIIASAIYVFNVPYSYIVDLSIEDPDEFYILFETLDGKRQILFHSLGA